MIITDAQADVRRIYRGGYSGPLVSAVVWAAANIVYQVVSPGAGMATLFFGGMLIFPLSSLILKVTAGASGLPKAHPSTGLVGIFVAPGMGPFSGWLGTAVLVIFVPILFRRATTDAEA